MNKLVLDSEEEFKSEKLCETLLKTLSQSENIKAELIFVSSEEIQKLNRETRKIDSITDVLSYPTLENIKGKILKKENYPFDLDEDGNIFIGSIAICKERAKEQAEEFGHSYERELYYLTTHGLLHLFGYDHLEEKDKEEMRKLEEEILQMLNITREVK